MRGDRLDPSSIEERLRGGRYTPTDATLDRLSRAARVDRTPPARADFWRSRLALVLTLVFGIGLSASGGALAVSGIASSDDAATAQYGNGVQGAGSGGSSGGGETLGEGTTGAGSESAGEGTQASGQTGATGSGGSLPFTGYLAIPLVAAGLVLLGSGLILRRKALREH
jgi:hypothetical protein